MKYVLNQSKIKTTNNYKINNIELDLSIPNVSDFKEFKVNSDKVEIKKEIINNFKSEIGLEFDKCYRLEMNVKNNIDEPIIIEYDFDDSKILVNEIDLNLEESADFIIKYKSEKEVFNNVKLIVKAKDNVNANISVVNLLDCNSNSFIAVENYLQKNAKVKLNFIDLGGKSKISNIYSKLEGDNSLFTLNNIYLGLNEDIIDMNYYIEILGKNADGKIMTEGVLNDYSKKSFKGTLDFIKGCTNSNGEELENVILLSDTCKSKSLPMLLCHEEDVTGSHGVSTGKIDESKLFYLMTKGLTEKEAIKLIISSNLNKIISEISNQNIKNEILNIIENKL